MSDFSGGDPGDEGRAAAQRCLEVAGQRLAAGCTGEAQAFLTQAAQLHPPSLAALAEAEGAPLRALAARTLVMHSPRGPEIARPCAILGPAGADLDPDTEALVRGIFDHHQRRFEAGAMPPLAGLYDSAAPDGFGRGRRTLVVMAERIHGNPDFIENDVFHHVARSAAACGLDVRTFAADRLVGDTPNRAAYTDAEIAAAWADLQRTVASFRPEIVVIQSDWPTGRTLDLAWARGLRAAYGSRIVVVLGDVYDTEFDFLGFWAPEADALVYFNSETTYPLMSGSGEKAFLAHGLPMDEALFAGPEEEPEEEKEFDVALIGGNTRSRREMLVLLQAYGVPVAACLHHRLTRSSPTLEQYGLFTRKARMTLNTGRVEKTRALSIVTGRCFEAVLARTVLLEEAGSRLSDYLQPFVHYVPFANTDQLVGFTRFLLRHADYRRRIADQAFDWHHRRFGGGRFWRALLGRLFGA